MGNSNSQVASQQSSITVPVWKGTWSSSNIPFVYGTFQLNYYDKFHTVPNGTSEIDVTINYATFSLYRPGAIINVKFDLDIKNTEECIYYDVSMKSKGMTQSITYNATLRDLNTDTVSGEYNSSNPYDFGTFELKFE